MVREAFAKSLSTGFGKVGVFQGRKRGKSIPETRNGMSRDPPLWAGVSPSGKLVSSEVRAPAEAGSEAAEARGTG